MITTPGVHDNLKQTPLPSSVLFEFLMAFAKELLYIHEDLSSDYADADGVWTNMDQLYQQVCMMSGATGADSTSREDVGGSIKQEEDRYCVIPDPRELPLSLGGSAGGQSPSTTVLYSPSKAGPSSADFDYTDCKEELGSSPRQPKRCREPPSLTSSPERQYCSSTTSTDPIIPSPEGLKEEEDTPKRTCMVCGDVSSGFHYGVASCEACKAFFKRTIQGNIEYNCPAANDCEINKRRRKACQACRFHKCLRVGMLKEGVRLDRVRGGRQKYRRTADSPFSLSSSLSLKKTPLDEIKLLVELQNCEPDLLVTMPVQSICEPEFLTVATLADLYDRELVSTIGWAKQMPGFTMLCLNDKMRLLQSTWGEILTLSLAYRSTPSSTRLLRYAHNFSLDEAQARECNAGELFTQILGVVERLEQCNILKEEFLLLKALVLTNSDVRLQDSQALFRLRQSILQSIHDAVSSLRNSNATAHMQSLLLCLPSLRAADTCLRRFWLAVRHEGNVPLKKLFLEMLESHPR